MREGINLELAADKLFKALCPRHKPVVTTSGPVRHLLLTLNINSLVSVQVNYVTLVKGA